VSQFGDLAIVIVLLALGGAFILLRRLARVNPKIKQRLDACDYVVFEAHPDQLQHIEDDLAPHGWRLAKTEPTGTAARLYRFEKVDGRSAPLSKIFEFEHSMARTADRRIRPEFPIKIKDHGKRTSAIA
jgi:hypothetical protein